MTYPLVKFVDSPAVGATVRFDMSTTGVQVGADGFTLGAPSLAGDPGSPAVEYGYRRITLKVLVTGTKANALAAQASLWAEMLRTDNYLLFQLTATSTPVWYHTYATEPGELSLENVYESGTNDQWQIEVSLDADNFGIGAQETIVSGATVTFDPDTAVTNPCRYTYSGTVKGDYPAPLIVSANWAQAKHGYQPMIATSRSNGYVWQVGGSDGWTAGTDTAASSSDALFSGGTLRVVSFATVATMATRLSGAAPAAVANGRYRVLVRAGRSDATSQFAFRFATKVVLSYQYGDTVQATWGTSTGTTHAAWVDLGIFQIPGGDLRAGTYTPDIALDVQRLSGSGTAKLDAIKLIPVDGTVLFADHYDLGPLGGGFTVAAYDGEAELYYATGGAGPISSQTPRMAGGWPTVVPGTNNNVVHILSQTSLARSKNSWQDCPDRIADTASVTLRYRPRYLNLPV